MSRHVVDLKWGELCAAARGVKNNCSKEIFDHISADSRPFMPVYGIPRGGIHAAHLVVNAYPMSFCMTENPEQAGLFVDDIVDSGKTRAMYVEKYKKPFFALINKTGSLSDVWYTFPWERMSGENGPEENVRRLIEYIGDDPKREGVVETPKRVIKSYEELFSGYKSDPASVFKTFDGDRHDEMVICKDIELFSCCEHHMLPFFGKAHIAYLPQGKRIVGLSKLARLLEVFSRRLQVQERLTDQITEALERYLQPRGAACVIQAKHFCMCARGVGKQHSEMITSSLTGVFKSDPATRAEFFGLIK